MITTLLYLFAFIFVLSLVVIVHEGGHFIMARLCGVSVVEFSLGFGKELFGWTDKKGTRWKVCALPFGGYVKMLGDEDAASAKSGTKEVAPELRPYTFMAQKLWKRAAIIFAGPAMNYVFAVFVLTGVLWSVGQVIIPAVVGSVEEGSAAAEAGLLAGDEIIQVNGKKVVEFSDIQRMVQLSDKDDVFNMRIRRDGAEVDVVVHPKYDSESERPRIGVISSMEAVTIDDDVGLGKAFVLSVQNVSQMTVDTVKYLKQVIMRERSGKDMRGPIGIAEASGDALRGGLLSLIVFIAQISVAIGFMNLLPIPLLDGGHLFFYAIEAVRRKPLPDKAQNVFLWAGLSFLMALLAYTLFLDIPRVWMRIIG